MLQKSQQKIDVKSKVVELLVELKSLKSLVPCAQTGRLFGDLVKMVRQADVSYDESDLDLEGVCSEMNGICARGEALLEKYWVNKFLEMRDFHYESLKEFIYFESYQLLAEWEYRLMSDYLAFKPSKLMFVGSGALPLSAIMMAKCYGVKIDCVDYDEEAVLASGALIERCGLGDLVKVKSGDFFEQEDFADYDLVMVAALVGEGEVGKKLVIEYLKSNLPENKAFLMRSAKGWKTLLYQEVKSAWLKDFKNVQVFDPREEVINSVVLAKN